MYHVQMVEIGLDVSPVVNIQVARARAGRSVEPPTLLPSQKLKVAQAGLKTPSEIPQISEVGLQGQELSQRTAEESVKLSLGQ
jgi:hypothetical protein